MPECRVMFTRVCPISGCEDLPCARFETDDVSRWDLDKAEWEKTDADLRARIHAYREGQS